MEHLFDRNVLIVVILTFMHFYSYIFKWRETWFSHPQLTKKKTWISTSCIFVAFLKEYFRRISLIIIAEFNNKKDDADFAALNRFDFLFSFIH